jgi:hypothetical protein
LLAVLVLSVFCGTLADYDQLTVLHPIEQTTSRPVSAKTPNGLSQITISEADSRSFPAPGAELHKMVDTAKQNGNVPMIYDSSVIRLIDGKWMAPQMCGV